MNKIIFLLLIALFITNCKKDDLASITTLNPSEFIIAGDSLNCLLFSDDYVFEGFANGDSVPSWNYSSSGGYQNLPVSFDIGEKKEFRYGCSNCLVNNYLIYRSFFISNNYENKEKIDFAINPHENIGMRNDTIKTVNLFSYGDTINKNQIWLNSGNVEYPYPNEYFISYYYDYDNDNNLRFPQDSEPLKGCSLFINRTVTDKYIGLRKKVDNKYVYGFIRFSIINYDHFKLLEYAFAEN
jgi:hypothetical protein